MSDQPAAWMVTPTGGAYRGKKGCKNVLCTRLDMEDCYGWHCALCDEPTDAQGGHRCLLSADGGNG